MTTVRHANLIRAIKEAIGLDKEQEGEAVSPHAASVNDAVSKRSGPPLAKIREIAQRAAMNEAQQKASRR